MSLCCSRLSLPVIVLAVLTPLPQFCVATAAAQEASEQSSNSLAGFSVPRGFRLELVASEPQVTAPVAMAFDENGRLFVAEMPAPPEGATTGRIRLLEDRERNGTFNVSSVYAEGIPWPTSIACYDGGIFVSGTPDIWYLKDTRKKGIADVRRKVFSGFGGTNTTTIDPNRLVTGLCWGPDGRIHGLTAGIGGSITSVTTREPLELGRNDFSFDPRTLEFRPEVGPGQSALAFDSRGRKFITDPARPLCTPTYELAALARNPFAPAPLPLVDVMRPATVLFQTVEEELAAAEASKTAALKVLPEGTNATSQSITGKAPETLTNRVAPTSFTAAQGTVFYGGNLYPTNFVDNVFVADPVARVVHRGVLRENGLFPVVDRSANQSRSEFLSASRKDFYPTAAVNGPEGILYVADRTHNPDHGRIYRIVPAGFKQPIVPQLAKFPAANLVATLASPNAWQRESAARLLYEGQDPAAVAPLTNMINNSRLPLARMQALRVLANLGAINEPVVIKCLKDPDARLRAQAANVAQILCRAGPGSDDFRNQLQALVQDPSINVRYQLAFTLGDVGRPGRAAVLAELLFRDSANPLFQSAVLSSLDLGAPELLKGLATTPRFRNVPALQPLLPDLAQMIGARGRLDEVKSVLDFLYSTKLDAQMTYGLLYNLGEGLHRTRSSLTAVDQQNALRAFYDAAVSTATDPGVPPATRAEATRLLGISSYTYADIGDWVLLLLAPRESAQVQLGAVSALTHMADPRGVMELFKRWSGLQPQVRQQAIGLLINRNDRAAALLTALQNRVIPITDFTPPQLDFLRTLADPAMSQKALQLLGPVQFQRAQALEKFTPATRLPGVAARGRELFVARCASCHWASTSPGGVRRMSLAPVRTHTKDQLLSAIVEPNADVRLEDKTQIIETKDAEYYVGLLLSENATTVCLLQADGTPVVVPRSNIQRLRSQPWSLMPAGLESGISLQGMADLLEFLARE